MAMNGKYFTYNNKSTKDYNLVLVDIDGTGEQKFSLNRESGIGSINKYNYSPMSTGSYYSECLSFPIHLVKGSCENGIIGTKISLPEINEINSWLTSTDYPTLLNVFHEKDSDYTRCYFGVFTEIEPFYYGDLYGVKTTFQSNSPFAYTDEIKSTISSTGVSSVEIVTQSALWNDYIYPILKVTPNESNPSGDESNAITIENESDGNKLSINKYYNGVSIYIDCKKLKIYDHLVQLVTFEDLGIQDVDDIYWFRLLGHDINKINITGNCTIEITYREPRKVGSL